MNYIVKYVSISKENSQDLSDNVGKMIVLDLKLE